MVINSRYSNYNSFLPERSLTIEKPVKQALAKINEIEKSSKVEESNRTELNQKRRDTLVLENAFFRTNLNLN